MSRLLSLFHTHTYREPLIVFHISVENDLLLWCRHTCWCGIKVLLHLSHTVQSVMALISNLRSCHSIIALNENKLPKKGGERLTWLTNTNTIFFSWVFKVLCKNRYVGRSFIQPTTRLRQLAVARKFGPYIENIVGKRIVLVDDSIVRGTTMQPMVALLRSCGAKEVRNFVLHPVCTSLYTWQ